MLAWPALPSFVPSPTPATAACKSTFMSCRSPAPVARLQGPTFGKAPATTSGGSSSSSSAAPPSLVRTLLTLALVVSSMLPPATMMAAPEPPAMVALAPQRRGEPPTALPTTMSLAAADEPAAPKPPSQKYLLFTGFPFPLGPFTERKTVESELVKGRVYSFEQEIRLSGISANVRCTVFRMRDNHLLVYNPVAPTDEFLAQLKALEGLRVEKGITDKTKTMEGQATDCAQFVKNLKDAGISVSADEYTKWSAGKMTDADLKTIESRIKAMSDSASSESQMINLEMQKANNAMQQSTNMFMSFLDSFKQIIDKIFR